jgi:hypothetical protein
MNNYFLDLHKRLLRNGLFNGLCHEIHWDYTARFEVKDVFGLFQPSEEEEEELLLSGLSSSYWGSEMSEVANNGHDTAYTPLRQTIVLFCHEILNTP